MILTRKRTYDRVSLGSKRQFDPRMSTVSCVRKWDRFCARTFTLRKFGGINDSRKTKPAVDNHGAIKDTSDVVELRWRQGYRILPPIGCNAKYWDSLDDWQAAYQKKPMNHRSNASSRLIMRHIETCCQPGHAGDCTGILARWFNVGLLQDTPRTYLHERSFRQTEPLLFTVIGEKTSAPEAKTDLVGHSAIPREQ